MAARKTFTAYILYLSPIYVWSKVQSIRAEAMEAKNLKQKISQNRGEDVKSFIDEYQRKLESIPKWEEDDRLNIFFSCEAIKLIYKHKSIIPKEIIDVIMSQTGKEPEDLKIYDDENQQDNYGYSQTVARFFMEQLVQALDIKATADFKAYYKKDYNNNLPVVIGSEDDAVLLKLLEFAKRFQKGYVVELDNYLKMMIICQRSILKLPIIIMGPTGCGKTYLVQFLVKFLLRETCIHFTLHSGIREDELEEVLIDAINQADELKRSYEASRDPSNLYKPKKVWIFFDEFNTSPLQSLIEELICSRTCSFSQKIRETLGESQRMPENLVFVAACNPFRIKSGSKDVGLVHESAATAFSHRVYPIPETLLNYTWNFGQLEGKQEENYIVKMLINSPKLEKFYKKEGIKNEIIDTEAPGLTAAQKQAAHTENEAQKLKIGKKFNPLVRCIVDSQVFLRERESDSAVSLRDVERVIVIFAYLYDLLQSHGETAYDDALICTIFLNYFARIGSHAPRKDLDETLTKKVQEMLSPTTRQKIKGNMVFLRVFEEVSKQIMKDFELLKCIPADIALNRSLRENLFALVCAILTKTPVMICGKPGTSKTLSTTIVKKFLDSKEGKAKTKYFKEANDVWFVTFSGSLVTTSDQVLRLFAKAEVLDSNKNPKPDADQAAQQPVPAPANKKETIVTILFDEMGLAEIGSDNPLKVLHPKLEMADPRFAFIGISNWKLDLSKMNRVLFIARPDLEKDDLIETCKSLREKDFIPKDRIEALSKAYFAFIQQESGKRVTYKKDGDGVEETVIQKYKEVFKEKHKHPHFFGSRDFYHIVKFLQRHLGDKGEFLGVCDMFKGKMTRKEDQADLLIYLAIQRNMSGKESQSIDDEKIYPSYQLFINIYNKILGKTDTDFHYTPINLMSMINMNLVDPGSRHLMLLTENPSVTDMLKNELKNYFINNLGYPAHTIMYLNRINNDKDIQVTIQSLPIWIANGYVLILKEVDEIYNCLYDVLNQRYSTKKDDNGNEVLVCEFHHRVAEKNKKENEVIIHPKFRVIVLCNREDDLRKLNERRQQPPFLNRFEKHLVLFKDLESVEQTDVKQALVTKYKLHRAKDSPFKSNTLIHSFSDEILSSVVLYNKQGIVTIVQDSVAAYFKQAFEAATSPKGTAQGRNRGEDKRKLLAEAEKSLIQLYSRNMLLYSKLEIADFRYTEDLVKQFQVSHQYDSLKELVEKMRSRQTNSGMTKVLLFTFSQLMEIKEIIANDRDLKVNSFLMDMEHFDTIESHQMADVIEDLVKRNKYFFILFDSKKAWSKIEILRSIVDNINFENHMIIFLAMYGYKDIRENSEENAGHGKLSEALMETEIFKNQTSITFLSTEWKLQVIDDLQNSNYKWFFKVLSTPLSEMMVSQELMFTRRMDQAPTDLLHQIVERELLTRFERANVDWKEQYILSQTDLLNEIKQEVTKIYREDNKGTVSQTIIDIIKKDTVKGDFSFRKLLGEHLDCIVVLKRVIEDAFTPYVVELLKKIGDSYKIDSMDDAIFLSRYDKEKIFRKWGTHMEEMVKAAANKKAKFQPPVKNLFDFSDVANNIIDFKKLPEDKIADLIKSIKTETEKLQRITPGPQGDKEMKSIMKNMKDSILEVLNDLEDTLTEGKFTFENSWGQPEYMLIGIGVLRKYMDSTGDAENQNVVHCLIRMVTYYMESTFRQGELSKPEQLNNICLLLIIFYAIFKDQFDFLKLQKNEPIPEERIDKMMRDFQKTFIIQIDILLGSNINTLKQPISDMASAKSRITDLQNLIKFMDNNKLRAENLESKDTHPINQNFMRVLLKMLEIKFANPTQGAFSSAKELFNTAAENTSSTLEYTLWLLENIDLNKDQKYEISRESLSMIDRTLKEEDISKIVIRHLDILKEQKRTRAIREVADRLVQFVSVNQRGEFFTGIAADVIAYVQSKVDKDLLKQLRLSMIEPVAKKIYELSLKERIVDISVEESFSKRNEIFMRTDTDLTRYLEVTGAAQYYLEKASIICSRDAIDISTEDAKFLQEVGDQLVKGLEQNKGLAIHDATFLLTKENLSNLSNFVPSLQTVTQDPDKKSVSTITDFLLPVKDIADLKQQNETKVRIRSQKINPDDLKKDNFDLVVQLASVCILDKKQPSAFLKGKNLPQDLMLLDNVLQATEDKKDAKNEQKLSSETRMILCSFATMTIKQKDIPALGHNHANFTPIFSEENLRLINGIKHFEELKVIGLALETFRSISDRDEKRMKDSLSKFESGVISRKVWEEYPGITSSLFNNIARILNNQQKNFGNLPTDIPKLDRAIEELKKTTKKTHLNSLELLLSSSQNSYLKDKDIKKEIANLVITQQLPLKFLEDPQVDEYSALSANRQAMHSTLDRLIRDLSKAVEAKDASPEDKTKLAYSKVLTALYNRRTFIARAARVILCIKDLQDTFKECINKKFAYAQLAPDAKPGPLTIGDLIGNHETLDGPITQSEFYSSKVRASYVEFVKVWKECYLPLVKEYPKELGDPRIDCKRVYEAILTEQKASKTTYSSSEIFNFLESLAYPSCPLSRLIIADDRMNKDSKNAIKMSPNFNLMRAIVIELLDEMDCISFAIWEAQQISQGIDPNSAQFRENQNNVVPFLSMKSSDLTPLSKDTIEDLIEKHVVTEREDDDSIPSLEDIDKLAKFFTESQNSLNRIYLNSKDYNLYFQDSELRDLIQMVLNKTGGKESRSVKERVRILSQHTKNGINREGLDLNKINDLEQDIRSILENNFEENWLNFLEDTIDTKASQKLLRKKTLHILKDIKIKNLALFLVRIYSLKLELKCENSKLNVQIVSDETARKVNAFGDRLKDKAPNNLDSLLDSIKLEAEYWKAEYCILAIDSKGGSTKFENTILMNPEKEKDPETQTLRLEIFELILKEAEDKEKNFKKRTVKSLKEYVGMLHSFSHDSKRDTKR
jgi:hypothetical protein